MAALKFLAAATAGLLMQVLQAEGQEQTQIKVWGDPRSECIDKNPGCLDWALNKECLANPTWMLPNCMMSCGSCAAVGGNSDVVEDCIGWAKDGECDKNYTWMFFNCPKSCKHTGNMIAAWWSSRSLGLVSQL